MIGMHSSSDSADWWNVEKATVNMGSRAELQGKVRGAGTHACQECPPNADVGIKAASPATARGCMRNTEMGGVEETSLGRCKRHKGTSKKPALASMCPFCFATILHTVFDWHVSVIDS